MAKFDLIIRGGRVIDPAQDIDAVRDVAVKNGTIAYGKVHPLIFEAMARGVRIDIGRGGHMSFDAARIALDVGVMPFIIGGDIHGYTIRRRDENRVWGAGPFGGEQGDLTTIGGTGAFSLVRVMNELIALGVGLTDVIRMVTVNAASMLGLTDELGSLHRAVWRT